MTTIRNEIPEQYKWDLSAIYTDMSAFDADFARAREMIARFPAYESTMTEDPDSLLSTLRDMTDIERIISKLYEYASLSSDVDKSDNGFLSLTGKVENLLNDAGAASYFVTPKLIRLDDETLAGWYGSKPELRLYERVIWKIRRYKPYTLSDEGEKLLADMQGGLGSHRGIRTIFADADLSYGFIKDENGKKVELTDANYVSYLMSGDRRVRRSAFFKMYETYTKFGNTFASLINASVKEAVTIARLRGYESSLVASVFNDEVTPDIYRNLINTVNANMDALYDYYDLKKEVLGLPRLHLYDIYAPLIGSCEKEYPFDQAVDSVLDAVRILGDEYHDTLKRGIEQQRWCDVFPSRGKVSGAYSAGCYDTQPYMLLNYTSKLDDVSTLAHEAGHSMHTYFSALNNEPQNSSYTIFVAEVASTVNELLFSRKKLRESDSDEEKLAILNQIMETYKGTLYRQTMFAEFELFMHESCESDEPLTKDLLCERYYEIVKRYFGKNVVCDPQIAYEWMRIPHFYGNFYVYKYATSISAASGIVKRIESEGEEYIKKYIDFLSCGGSKSPLDSLALTGIDLTKPDVIEDAISDFRSIIAQFRELYLKSKN